MEEKVRILRDINFGFCTLEGGTDCFVREQDGKLYFKNVNGAELSVNKWEIDKEANKEPVYVKISELGECLQIGSEVKLLTKDGISAYNVENITFKNDTYVSLSLKKN